MDIFEKIKYKVIVYGLPSLLIISYIITFIIRISGGNQFDYSVHALLANSNITNNPNFVTGISAISMAVNLFLVVAISYSQKASDLLKKYWILFVFSLLLVFVPEGIANTVNAIYFLLVLVVFSKKFKPVLIGILIIILQIPYQAFILWLRLGHIPNMVEMPFYQMLTFNLDQYIAMSILYIVFLYRKKVML